MNVKEKKITLQNMEDRGINVTVNSEMKKTRILRNMEIMGCSFMKIRAKQIPVY